MTIWTLKCPTLLVNAVHSGRLRASATKHEFRLTLTLVTGDCNKALPPLAPHHLEHHNWQNTAISLIDGCELSTLKVTEQIHEDLRATP